MNRPAFATGFLEDLVYESPQPDPSHYVKRMMAGWSKYRSFANLHEGQFPAKVKELLERHVLVSGANPLSLFDSVVEQLRLAAFVGTAETEGASLALTLRPKLKTYVVEIEYVGVVGVWLGDLAMETEPTRVECSELLVAGEFIQQNFYLPRSPLRILFRDIGRLAIRADNE